jgi:hypothetical protein
MEGPYDPTAAAVDGNVEGNRIGNYTLGNADKQGSLTVGYMGRSDTDLRAETKSNLGKKCYPHFKFSYATSATEAYLKECQNFHGFKDGGAGTDSSCTAIRKLPNLSGQWGVGLAPFVTWV